MSHLGGGVAMLAKSVDSVKAALEASSARKADLAAIALEAKLLDRLPASEEKMRRLEELLQRTRTVRASASGYAADSYQAHQEVRRDGEPESSHTPREAGGSSEASSQGK